MNYFVALLSRLLEPIDRECICGDVEELRLDTSAAAWNIVGLVIRRQLAEWSHVGPWAALFGVAGLTGSFLSGSLAGVEARIFVQARTYIHYGVAYQPGGVSTSQEVTYAATSLLVVLLCSWACGFVLSSLSGRAFWITSFLFYCNVRDSWAIRIVLKGNIVLKHELWLAMLFRLLPLGPDRVGILAGAGAGPSCRHKGQAAMEHVSDYHDNRDRRTPVARLDAKLVCRWSCPTERTDLPSQALGVADVAVAGVLLASAFDSVSAVETGRVWTARSVNKAEPRQTSYISLQKGGMTW